MIRKLDSGFESFKQCVNDMGEMIAKRGNDDCLCYDWFLKEAEEKFGKEIYSYIECAENENVSAFYRSYQDSKSYASPEETRVTIEQLINRANELEAKKLAANKKLSWFYSPFFITGLSRKFAKQSNTEEQKTLAQIALRESSDFIKTALLRAFRFVDFPLDIELLFPYIHSDSEDLRRVVAEALSRFKDKRIRALVPQLFNYGDVENALVLLEPYFEIEDESLMRKYILSSKKITYTIIRCIIDIYKKNKSNTCGDILLHFYKNVECTHCRCDIVEMMISHDVIPQNILNECLYDSYEETRELAEKKL
ncbi:MAG: HEAT repeat domain-containing protein [Leptospirales bacterium]|nr:HEAT repeat domain-containing protein [Leptospirales bacterium]